MSTEKNHVAPLLNQVPPIVEINGRFYERADEAILEMPRADDATQQHEAQLVTINQHNDQKELKRIDQLLEKQEKKISLHRRQELANQAEGYIASSRPAAVADSVLKAFSTTPEFAQTARFLSEALDELKAIANEFSNPTVFADRLKSLFTAQLEISPGTTITFATIVGEEKMAQLSLLAKSLRRRPSSSNKQSEAIDIILQEAQNELQNPTGLVKIILRSQITTDATRRSQLDTVEQVLQALEPIQTYHSIISVLNQVEKTELPAAESAYLRTVVCKLLVEQAGCPPVWAADLASGKDIFTTHNLQEVIEALLYPYEEVKAQASTKQLKRLSRVLITLLLGAQLFSAQQPIAEFATAVAETTVSISKAIYDFATSPNDSSKLPLPEPEVEANAESATAELNPTPEPTATPVKEIARNVPPPLTEQDMSWSDSTTENQGVSSSATINPEQLRRQQSKIAWQIIKQPTAANYYFQRILPIYDPARSTFEPDYPTASRVIQHQVQSDISHSEFQMSAKRRNLDGTTLIPAPLGYQLDAARVTVYKNGQLLRELSISVGVTADNSNVILLNTDTGYTAAADEVLKIEVGLSPKKNTYFDTTVIHTDADAAIMDKSILPQELQQLVAILNANTNLSDLDKLQQLKSWFLENFQYAVNPAINEYYWENYPTTEQQMRRIFGTGSVDDDPSYRADPKFWWKGICSSANTLYGATARLLNLQSGQVLLAAGYLHLPFTAKNKDLLTEGSYHAWSIYISNDGEVTILDATPTQKEDFTSDVFESLDSGSEFSEAAIQKSVIETETSSQYPELYTMPEVNYDIESILDNFPDQPEKEFNWHIRKVQDAQGFTYLVTVPDQFGLLPFATTLVNGKWTIPTKIFPLNHTYDLQDSPPISKDSYLAEVSTRRKLRNAAFWLPNLGIINPSSIRVYKVSDQNPTIKVPVAIKSLQGSAIIDFDKRVHEYVLTLDVTKAELAQNTFEISYSTTYAGIQQEYLNDGFINISIDQSKELFNPIVDRSVFDPKLQKLLEILDGDFQPNDLAGTDYILHLSQLYDSYNDILSNPSYEATSKILLVNAYIRENFEITFSPEWRQMYHAGNDDTTEYIKRIFIHRKIDPQSYIDLLAAIISTIQAKDAGFTMPFIVTYTTNNALPSQFSGLSLTSNNQQDPNRVSYDENFVFPQLKLLHYSEKDGVRYFVPYTAGYRIDNLIDFYRNQTINSSNQQQLYDAYSPPYDPIAREKVSYITKELLSSERKKNSHDKVSFGIDEYLDALNITEYIKDFTTPKLTNSELQQAIIKEYFEIEFYKWLYARGKQGILLELGAAALVGFLLGDWVRRRTSWMRGFRAEMVEEILQEAVAKFGEKAKDTPIYQDLHDFLIEVLQPSQGKFSPFKRIAQALRMKGFASRKYNQGSFFDESYSAALVPHLPVVGTHAETYLKNFRDSTGSEPITAYVSRKTLHELFKRPFTEKQSLYLLEVRFEDELELILETQGWPLKDVMRNLLDEVLKLHKNNYLGLTPKSLTSPSELEKKLNLLEAQVLHHLYARVWRHVRKQSSNENLTDDAQAVLKEISKIIVKDMLLPYVQRIFAEEALLRKKHGPKSIRDIFRG